MPSPLSNTKKPAANADRFQPGLFSHLFNVAASRPAKSPRDKIAIPPLTACVNSSILVLSAAKYGWDMMARETGILADRAISALFDTGRLRSEKALDRDQIQPASL